MKRFSKVLFLIVPFIFLNINCGAGGGSGASDTSDGTFDTLSNLESSIFDVENLPVTIAKLDSISPSAVHITDVTSDVSLSQSPLRFLTTQSTCNAVLEITVDAGGIADTTTTPGMFLHHQSLGYNESYANVVQSNGAVLASSDVQICANATSDQILVSGLTASGDTITLPVIIELNNGNEILSLTASTNNLANSQNILVSSDGEVYAVILDGSGGSSIYEMQPNGSTGTAIATLTDIPIVLDIFTISSTTYLYYFNQNGVFKELTITASSTSISSSFLVQAAPLYTTSESTIQDFSVTTDGNFVIHHEDQNDDSGSMIVFAETVNATGHRSTSYYQRPPTGDLSSSIRASVENVDTFLAGDALGLTYIYIAGASELDDCNFGAGCIALVSTNDLGSFAESDTTTNFEVTTDDIHLVISDESTNALTQVLSLVREVDTTAETQTTPNGFYARTNGEVVYFDNAKNSTELGASTNGQIVRIAAKSNANAQTLLLGCENIGDKTVLSVFVPSADTALRDKLQNGTWQQLNTPDSFESCSATDQITIGEDFSVYFYRSASDGTKQISLIDFGNNALLQSGLLDVLPE